MGDYPHEFSSQALARVEAERLKANRELEQAWAMKLPDTWTQGRREWDQCAFYAYILRVFRVFGHQACELGKQGTWRVDRIRSEADGFLRGFAIEAYYEKGHGRDLPRMADNWGGGLLLEVERKFQESEEWHQFEEELLAVAELQAVPAPPAAGANCGNGTDQRAAVDTFISKVAKAGRKITRNRLERSGGKSRLGSPLGDRKDPASTRPTTAASPGSDRRAMIDRFISRIAENGHRITRKDIWTLAGYRDRTEFERFQRDDRRSSQSAVSNFNRILSMEPEDFLQALAKKKALA